MNRWKVFILLVFIVFIAACSGAETENEKVQYDKPERFTVETMVIKNEIREDTVSFPGTVTSDDTVMLMPKIMGYIERINVDIGDSFGKNDPLVSIKSGELTARKNRAESAVKEARTGLQQAESGIKLAKMKKRQAEAQFNLSDKTYKRYKRLLESDSVSQQEYDQVEAEYLSAKESYDIAVENVNLAKKKLSQAEAQLAQAQTMLSEARSYINYKTIKAPFDGIVLDKLSEEGNLASPGSAVLKIGSRDKIVSAEIGERLFKSVAVGDNVTVVYPSEDISFAAKIKNKSGQIMPSSRKFTVETTSKDVLPAGAYVKVIFSEGMTEGIFIPMSAVKQMGQLNAVIIKAGDHAEMRILKLGRQLGNKVEVLSGLDAGEKLVLNNVDLIESGDILEEK